MLNQIQNQMEPTWQEILQELREEAEELIQSDRFKGDYHSSASEDLEDLFEIE